MEVSRLEYGSGLPFPETEDLPDPGMESASPASPALAGGFFGASLVAQMADSACSVGDPGSTSGLGGSPGEGNGNPLQYSCLDNPMNERANNTHSPIWEAPVKL